MNLAYFPTKRIFLSSPSGEIVSPFQRILKEIRETKFSKNAQRSFGGEGGIRTPVTVPRERDFESRAFNRARPPLRDSCLLFSLSERAKEIFQQRGAFRARYSTGHRKSMI